MKTFAALVFSTLVGLAPFPAYAFDGTSSGKDLLNSCTEAIRIPPTKDIPAFWYCYGAIAGVSGAIKTWELADHKSLVCVPESITKMGITTALEMQVVVRYLTAHPQELHYHFASLVIDALVDSFPCPPVAR